jgi:demethylmenaquinone methyltransferase/2-methoxy-6-polyprenyl-1,4-benzoquinol methylase
MFGSIAGRYDLLNRLLSFGIDRGWRRRAARRLAEGVAAGERPDGAGAKPPSALDLCCGTADLALDLAAAGFRVVGVDFSHEMLVRGRAKTARAARRDGAPAGRPIVLAEADALRLPFPDGGFAAAAVAFGVRNLEDLDAGLAEIRRVLGPGGRLAVLEFGRPRGRLAGAGYRLYLNLLVPLVGRIVSKDRGAYAYLASSIQGFPDQEAFPGRLLRAGFTEVRCESLTLGVAALYLALKPGPGPVTP